MTSSRTRLALRQMIARKVARVLPTAGGIVLPPVFLCVPFHPGPDRTPEV